MHSRDSIQIQLTTEQKQQIEAAFGRSTDTIELTIQELEQRITPDFLITKVADSSSPNLFRQ